MPTDKKNILNIGCGKKIMPNAVNLDIIKHEGVDVVCDIKNGLPFGPDSFKEVICDYVLCQICEPERFKFVLNDIWRVLEPGGVLKMKVPDARYPCAFQDPMDCRYFVKETFDYFNKDHYRYQAFQYGFKPWEVVSVEKERKDRLYAILRKPK